MIDNLKTYFKGFLKLKLISIAITLSILFNSGIVSASPPVPTVEDLIPGSIGSIIWSFSCSLPDDDSSPPPTTEFDFNNIPDAWKTKFPFDLVYPVDELGTPNLQTKCPQIKIFDITRDACAPHMMANVAKDAFLLSIALRSIFSL